MKKEYVSFYKIAQEMFNEKPKEERDCIDFKNYYERLKEQFKEILDCTGIDNKILMDEKEHSYKILKNKKDKVKEFLKEYKSPAMKRIRNSKRGEVSIKELEKHLSRFEDIIKETLNDKDYQHARNLMYIRTDYPLKKKLNEIKEGVLSQIVKEMEELNPASTGLTYMDVFCLLECYRFILSKASEKWKSIVLIANEIRKEEVNTIDERIYDSDLPEDEEEKLLNRFSSSEAVILEAIHEYDLEEEDMELQVLNEPTSAELAKVEEIIAKRKSE